MSIDSSLIGVILVVILWVIYLVDRGKQASKFQALEEQIEGLSDRIKDLKALRDTDNQKLTQLEIEVSNIR